MKKILTVFVLIATVTAIGLFAAELAGESVIGSVPNDKSNVGLTDIEVADTDTTAGDESTAAVSDYESSSETDATAGTEKEAEEATFGWVLSDGQLIISGTGEMPDWSYSSPAPWYEERDAVKSVSIEEGITTVGSYAFYDCSNLRTAELADSIVSIKTDAFTNCTGLEEICLPTHLVNIWSGAFAGCSTLTAIIIPDSTEWIGGGAFRGCSSLTSVSMSAETETGANAFEGCNGLADDEGRVIINDVLYEYVGEDTLVTVPDGIRTIAPYAFQGCDFIENISFPGTLRHIGYMAFSGCSSLTALVFPASLETIGLFSFSFCTNLKYVMFFGDCPEFTVVGEDIGMSTSYIYRENSPTLTIYYDSETEGWDDISHNFGTGDDIYVDFNTLCFRRSH